MSADLTTFGGRLLQARLDQSSRLGRRVTQEAVAQVAGVVANAVSKWEGGATLPDIAAIERMAHLLGVSPGWLAFGEDGDGLGARGVSGPRDVRPAPITKLPERVAKKRKRKDA